MKFCHNNSSKKRSQGLSHAGLMPAWSSRIRHAIAWSLPIASLLAVAPTAHAQVAAVFDWGTGAAGDEIDFPAGSTVNTYTNVNGSGVDVQISVVGADTTNGNPNLVLGDSDFVSPSQPDETLFLGITGQQGAQATVTIQFFQTGTTTPVDVTLTSFPLFDVDVLLENGTTVSWQDQVVVSASSGGAAVGGITAGGEAPPAGIFNKEVAGPTSVTITGVNTTVGPPNAIDNITANANSPRIPGLTNATTAGNFEEGNVIVNIPAPADTITVQLGNGPGTEDFDPHAIAIGDISFTAPAVATTPVIGVAKTVSAGPTETAPGSGIFDITYSVVVENLGNEALNGVQLLESFTDPITAAPTFGPGNIISSTVGAIVPAGGASLTPNPNYNVSATGAVDANLLTAAASTLPVGASATIPITVQVDSNQADFPADGGDGYNNQVTASGVGATSGNPVNDLSDDGVDPDPDADGNPGGPGEGDPTPVTIPTPAEAPAIGVSKRVVSTATQADGDFEVVYETTVENLGNVVLNNVQLTEDLDDTYGEGAFSIISAPVFSARGLANEVQLAPNPGFDADAPNGTPGDTGILAAAQTLQVGQNSTFRFTVEVESDLVVTPGTFNNQIDAAGTSPNNTTVNDASDDGLETDSDPNDGNPGGGPTENDPTPVQLPPVGTPAIGVSKRVVSATTQADGDFEVVYETTVENLGDVVLNNVQLTEDLDDTYGEGAFSVIGAPTFTARGLANEIELDVNGNFDADAPNGTPGDVNILAPTQTLQVGQNSTYRFTVEVESDLVVTPGTFTNQIEAVGTSPNNITVDDASDDGTETDSDPNDGIPGGGPGENDPTPVQLPPVESPAIGVSKRVVSAITQADGDFEVVYETTVENLGNVLLNNVQLTEDLDDTYGEGAFSIIGGPVFTARGLANEVALAPNDNFDADEPNGTPGDTSILAPGQTLQIGENSTFQFTVEVESDLVNTPDTFLNQIEAVGTSPNNATVNDVSDDGTETDSDPGDGIPGGGPGENDPTPVALPPRPVIGVAKQVVSTVLEPAGSFGANTARVTYDIVVANIGTVPLEQVQLEEDLNPVYGAGTFQVVDLTFSSGATTVAADPGFDGITGSNTTLLADAAGIPNGTLAVGDTSTFQLVVDIDISSPSLTPALPGPYDNQVSATATDANGNPTSDLSDSGTDVDPDGDGEPNEDNGTPPDPDNPDNDGNENTPTRVRFAPDVRLVKRITRVTRNGTEVAIPNIGGFNDQGGSSDDNTLAALSGSTLPLGLPDVSQALQSGDLVEYTIYFFNAGLGTAENLEVCDELQPPSVLQPDSLTLAPPTALSTAGTTLNFSNIGPFSPRAPLSPLEPSCISAPGTFPSGVPAGGLGVGAGGGVVVGGPASGLNVETGEVGAFRFEIQLP